MLLLVVYNLHEVNGIDGLVIVHVGVGEEETLTVAGRDEICNFAGIIDVYGIVRRGIDIICQVITIAGVDGSTPTEVVPIGSALHL